MSTFRRALVALAVSAGLMTIAPAAEALTPRATLAKGVTGSNVLILQDALNRNRAGDFLAGSNLTTYFGPSTETALKAWERRNRITANGWITAGSREWNLLMSQRVAPRVPSTWKLDRRCYTLATTLCASKANRKIYYIWNYRVITSLDARFGGLARDTNGVLRSYETANGQFKVFLKVRDEVSRKYNNAPMPFSMYFYGGQAVHFSSGFVANGWTGGVGSHGCINLRSYSGAEWFYNRTPVGSRVVVY